jgi:hypothetical protein
MVLRWGTAFLIVAIVPNVAAASAGLSGLSAVPGLSGVPVSESACGDTVSQLVCTVVVLVLGPNGVVPFAAQEASWAERTATSVVGGH